MRKWLTHPEKDGLLILMNEPFSFVIDNGGNMAIRKKTVLSKEDFEGALVTLRLSVSEVQRDTRIPRGSLSQFRNYGEGLRPE